MLWRLNFLFVLDPGTTYVSTTFACCTPISFSWGLRRVEDQERMWSTKWGVVNWPCLALTIYVIWDLRSPIFRWLHLPFFGETPCWGGGEP
jgi:hypothetical protein